MNVKQQLSQLKTALNKARNVLIFLSDSPTYDHLAAGLSLYLGVLKQGKQATIASSTPMLVEDSDLVGIDKIKNSLEGKNLIVSLPYEEGKIEKVSYNFEGDKFNLVVEPKDNILDFSVEDVEFSTGGLEADFIFTIGVKNLTDIGKLYSINRDLFEKRDLSMIDNSPAEGRSGTINIINPQLPTISEIVVLVLKNLGVVFDKDISTNLYKGLQKGTNDFDPKIVSALTFEAAALCLRSGASKTRVGIRQQKMKIVQSSPENNFLSGSSGSNTSTILSRSTMADNKQKNILPPIKVRQKENVPDTTLRQTHKKTVPSDWLKPKIFSSSGEGDQS